MRMPDTKPMQYRIVDRSTVDRGDERDRVSAALLGTPASIAPKYFYDELGCALYGAICRLPEYYPTRTEVAIFRDHRLDIAQAIGSARQFVDLGAGDCCKAQAWLPFVTPSRYIAVDIAGPEIERALARMSPDYPEIEMIGVIADFASGLPIDDVLDSRAATFFYPGSSIGNFTPGEALDFLHTIRTKCEPRPGSGLLIGVDGKKGKAVLDAAYDDALGVTAAFNRNALLHLEALRDQSVRIGDRTRRFARGERIHTENSYKYRAPEFESLLRSAGFTSVAHWASPDEGFFVFYAS
jgi:L-histidine N-alpha-methyltransferase